MLMSDNWWYLYLYHIVGIARRLWRTCCKLMKWARRKVDEKWPDKYVDKRGEREKERKDNDRQHCGFYKYKYGSCPRGNSTFLRSSVSPSHIRLVLAFIRSPSGHRVLFLLFSFLF